MFFFWIFFISAWSISKDISWLIYLHRSVYNIQETAQLTKQEVQMFIRGMQLLHSLLERFEASYTNSYWWTTIHVWILQQILQQKWQVEDSHEGTHWRQTLCMPDLWVIWQCQSHFIRGCNFPVSWKMKTHAYVYFENTLEPESFFELLVVVIDGEKVGLIILG